MEIVIRNTVNKLQCLYVFRVECAESENRIFDHIYRENLKEIDDDIKNYPRFLKIYTRS